MKIDVEGRRLPKDSGGVEGSAVEGADFLVGGADNDTLHGGNGTDTIDGGLGKDHITNAATIERI